METKKMIVGVLLISAFALPAFATFEKDVITPEALAAVLKAKMPVSNTLLEEAVLKGAEFDQDVISEDLIETLANSKTIVSKTVLEEALLKNSNDRVGAIPCGESCVYIPCLTSVFKCKCKNKVCYR